ncbi:hypothetical protein [Chitinophaga terrae (ex Kim and Jung 2007)]|nr:hypothetical protein [Chitinophaga terrae (ex Kim and Jung 2007)]
MPVSSGLYDCSPVNEEIGEDKLDARIFCFHTEEDKIKQFGE